jgi:hypothetical protein
MLYAVAAPNSAFAAAIVKGRVVRRSRPTGWEAGLLMPMRNRTLARPPHHRRPYKTIHESLFAGSRLKSGSTRVWVKRKRR